MKNEETLQILEREAPPSFKPSQNPMPPEEIRQWRNQTEMRLGDLPKLVRHGNVDLVRQALARKPSPWILYGALVEACVYGHVDIVKLLIDHKVEVELRVNAADEDFEPVMIASILNRLDILELLLKAGASTYSINRSASRAYLMPLQFACAWGNLPMVELLAEPDALESAIMGINLIQLASHFGRPTVLEFLRSIGMPDQIEQDFVDPNVEHSLREIHRRVVLQDFSGIGWDEDSDSVLKSEYGQEE